MLLKLDSKYRVDAEVAGTKINVAKYDIRALGCELDAYKTYTVRVVGLGLRQITDTLYTNPSVFVRGYTSITIEGLGSCNDAAPGIQRNTVGIFGVLPTSEKTSPCFSTRVGPSSSIITVTFWGDTAPGGLIGDQPLFKVDPAIHDDMGHYELLLQITEI